MDFRRIVVGQTGSAGPAGLPDYSAAGFSARRARMPLSTSMEEERLAEAEVCLYRAKQEAILGTRYDADEYDRIVERYRAAKRHADEARLAAHQAHAAQAALSSKGGSVPLGSTPDTLSAEFTRPHAA